MDISLYAAALASVYSLASQDILLLGISLMAVFFLYNRKIGHDFTKDQLIVH